MSRSESSSGENDAKFRIGLRSLTSQLFLITVAPLTVLLLAFTFGSLSLHQQAMRRMVGERDLASVHTAAAAIQEQIRLRVLDLRLLSDLASGAEAAGMEALLQKTAALEPNFEYGVAFLSPSGSVEALNGEPTTWRWLIQAARPQLEVYFSQRPDQAEPLILTVDHPQTGEPVVMIVLPAADGQGATAGAFSASALAERVLAGSEAHGHTAAFLLVDRQQQTLYRTRGAAVSDHSADRPGVAEALSGRSGTAYFSAADSEHVVAYAPVGSLGWGLISEEPWAMVDTPLLRTTQAAPLILAPVLILALLALWFAARQIVRPLQNLEARSALLAQGNFTAIEDPVGGISEVRRLQAELIRMARRLEAAQQNLHSYIQAITGAQEDERRRLARELHDETIQSLIALKQQVQLARLDASRAGDRETLDKIAAMTEQTIDELRRLIRALRPIYLEDLGLAAALEMLGRETSQSAETAVKFAVQGTERRLGSTVELSLYRMAQEALSNVVRHAAAKNAALRIQFDPGRVILEVEDDGRGFSAPKNRSEVAPSDHFGILGLYERAELIGASLEFQSLPRRGTKLRICVPTDAVISDDGGEV